MSNETLTGEVIIDEAKPENADEVAAFCQPIYQAVYPNEKYGLTAEQFSPEIFKTEDTLSYFRDILDNNEHQRAYLARINGQLVGTISVTEFEDHYEPRCFYVETNLQGQGIGKTLWQKAMEFCQKPLPVRVEVAETNDKTIAMYESWGFVRKPDLGVKMRHWPEWPESIENGYIFLEKTPKS